MAQSQSRPTEPAGTQAMRPGGIAPGGQGEEKKAPAEGGCFMGLTEIVFTILLLLQDVFRDRGHAKLY